MYCRAMKDFFKKHDVQYIDFDVSTDAIKREEMIEKSGQMGVPVVFIGNEIIVGFDKERLSKLLDIS